MNSSIDSSIHLDTSSSPQMSQSSLDSPDQPVVITTIVGSGSNKRKEVMTLPLPPGALPPRKRAKTKDEKEQRRIERIMRNRQAAHASREKKRRHVEELEKKCILLASENNQLHSGFSQVKSQASQLLDKFKALASLVESAQANKTQGGLEKLDTQKLLAEATALLKPVDVSISNVDLSLKNTDSSRDIKLESQSESTPDSLGFDASEKKPLNTKSVQEKKGRSNNNNHNINENNNNNNTTTTADSPYSDSGSPFSVPSLSSSVASSPRSYPLDIMNKTESDSVMGLDDPLSFLGLFEHQSHHSAASVSEPEKDHSYSVVFNNLATIDDLEAIGHNPLAFSQMGATSTGLVDPLDMDLDAVWLNKHDFYQGEYDMMAGLDLLIPQVGGL